METLEQIKRRIQDAVPGARLEVVPNPCNRGQDSLLLEADTALEVARFLRDEPSLRFDYASNVTGLDWLDAISKEKVVSLEVIDGVQREIERVVETKRPGYLEVVYHLYSMALKHGPLIVRMRTANRSDQVRLPSLTPVWRGVEFQEREVFDLFGVVFEGHPDLRRILMWDEFEGHPMRKDYVEPDDYEYEPTAHDDVLEKSKRHRSAEVRR